MLKIGILGLSNETDLLSKKIKTLNLFEPSGVYEFDKRILKVHKNSDYAFQSSPSALISLSDALIISNTNDSAFNIVIESLKNLKTVFLLNPHMLTLAEANELQKITIEANVNLFTFSGLMGNAVFKSAAGSINNPGFIEMIHQIKGPSENPDEIVPKELYSDLDFIINSVHANIRKAYAKGLSVNNKINDLINIRIEFDNACVANLTINRLADEDKIVCNFFQKESVVSINPTENNYVITKTNKIKNKRVYKTEQDDYEALILKCFHESLHTEYSQISNIEKFVITLQLLNNLKDKFEIIF